MQISFHVQCVVCFLSINWLKCCSAHPHKLVDDIWGGGNPVEGAFTRHLEQGVSSLPNQSFRFQSETSNISLSAAYKWFHIYHLQPLWGDVLHELTGWRSNLIEENRGETMPCLNTTLYLWGKTWRQQLLLRHPPWVGRFKIDDHDVSIATANPVKGNWSSCFLH